MLACEHKPRASVVRSRLCNRAGVHGPVDSVNCCGGRGGIERDTHKAHTRESVVGRIVGTMQRLHTSLGSRRTLTGEQRTPDSCMLPELLPPGACQTPELSFTYKPHSELTSGVTKQPGFWAQPWALLLTQLLVVCSLLDGRRKEDHAPAKYAHRSPMGVASMPAMSMPSDLTESLCAGGGVQELSSATSIERPAHR